MGRGYGKELFVSIVIFMIIVAKVVNLISVGECHSIDVIALLSSVLLVAFLMTMNDKHHKKI